MVLFALCKAGTLFIYWYKKVKKIKQILFGLTNDHFDLISKRKKRAITFMAKGGLL